MRVIEWNCQMAFRKKNTRILDMNPDLLVIPECENDKKLNFGQLTPTPNDFLWFGENENKGLGIFSYSDYQFSIHPDYNPAFKIIVPIVVRNKEHEFLLFAVWANNKEDRNAQYIEQVWKAIHFYDRIITNEDVMILGDFNSSVVFDKKHRNGNHTDVVEVLKEKGINSLYHDFFQETQGIESKPTFYMYRNSNQPYHIDYCFVSKHFLSVIQNFEVGQFNDWLDISDHMPVIADFAT